MGTEFTTANNLNEMVNSAKNEIESGEIKRDYKAANSRSILSMEIGDSWKPDFSKKITWSLDYDGIHYGDFAEWYTTFTILTNNYLYYLFAHESYITPNKINTDDFRTDHMIYNFNTNSDRLQLRDYQPKAMNPQGTVSYGSNLGAEIGSDSSLSVSAGISSSYTVSFESPKIYDKGNMANNHVYIDFDYLNPWNNGDPWISYNTNQTMQTAIYIVKESRYGRTPTVMTDIRTLTIVRDNFWFWLDNSISFNYTFSYHTDYTNF